MWLELSGEGLRFSTMELGGDLSTDEPREGLA